MVDFPIAQQIWEHNFYEEQDIDEVMAYEAITSSISQGG